jgi:hypothetical protein
MMEIKVKRCYDCPFCQHGVKLYEPWYCSAPVEKPVHYWKMAKIEIPMPDWCPLPITLVKVI